ncbi:hypothetical protein HA149_07160 [Prochlorococcus marinus XMU1406]|uniref:hypothetical protein n=1 Tax=Prochlorococcus marinus TaxID=1219 RepID=UPI001AD9F291|nr:hypothetical protein [Prochlorococcus marinus]MBO8206835.1 hypothetical protein [Prochlorococcus marinus XMU1406]MCR8542654.1 hypothetical protein [Prochlorococcus marinus XMU1427]
MRIVDVSMFFNEINLLEIRLEALVDYIDQFIVIESNQTFSGKYKKHILPELSNLKKRYGDKLKIISRDENFLNYDHLLDNLSKKNNNFSKKESSYLKKIMIDHNHYDKSKINLLLDSFQREACSIYIDRYTDSNDLIIFSDADELPDNLNEVHNYFSGNKLKPISLKQHEFWYYPNIFHDSNWEGSIAGYSKDLKIKSLNWFRIKDKSKRINTITLPTINGYHLTNMGGVEKLKEKIKNWTHQEYNNFHIMLSLEEKIISGEDIFMRSTGTVTKLIKFEEFYSDKYKIAIINSSLPKAKLLKEKSSNKFKKFLNKVILKFFNFFR